MQKVKTYVLICTSLILLSACLEEKQVVIQLLPFLTSPIEEINKLK